ncbi:MAG: SpoIIE family protein phosphatase [Lachnospiraceae bacterium]|nr:SpoIIE family protein phosphatase [Lachnospiraceae bacterium]
MREKETFINILPEYGRRRLLMFADSIRDLAASFGDPRPLDTNETTQIAENSSETRRDILWQRRMQENKILMADHLQEVAQIMAHVADESRRFTPINQRRYKQIAHALKDINLQLKNIYIMEKENGFMELSLQIRSSKGGNVVTVEEIGDIISVLLNKRLTPSVNNPFFIDQELKTFYYVETPRFHVLTGSAVAVKENEKISGDNYAIFETEPGAYSMIISDGMGSGKKASTDSQMIVELMQKFIETGYKKEMAIQMINSVLLAGPEAGNMSTMDFCTVDLYTGTCELLKIGSAPTYIKRENLVERISAGNLPLGIFNRPDMDVNCRRLQDGDYIIMISDGVLDALSQGIGEDMMAELISGTDLKNPNEIANAMLNFCIRQSKGKVRDDMTVLVMGLWEYNSEVS